MDISDISSFMVGVSASRVSFPGCTPPYFAMGYHFTSYRDHRFGYSNQIQRLEKKTNHLKCPVVVKGGVVAKLGQLPDP